MKGELRVKYKDRKCKADVILSEDEAKALSDFIKRRGLKQGDLAKVFGITDANLSRGINGKRKLGMDVLYSLYERVGEPQTLEFVKDYRSLAERENFPLQLLIAESPSKSYEESLARLTSAYEESSEDQRSKILETLEGLVDNGE